MAVNPQVFKKMEITLDDSKKVSVAVNMSEVPDFKELPNNKHRKALQDWVKKKHAAGLAPTLQHAPDPQVSSKGSSEVTPGTGNSSSSSSSETHLPMDVTIASCKRPRSSNESTPTTPSSHSVETSPLIKSKKPCMDSPKSLQNNQYPVLSLVTSMPNTLSEPVFLVPTQVPPLTTTSPGEIADNVKLALSLVDSLKQLETGFSNKISEMNKALHDVKGLSSSVRTLTEDVEKNVKPQQANLTKAVNDLKDDIHKDGSGVEPRLKELECKVAASASSNTAQVTDPTTSLPFTTWSADQIQSKFTSMQEDIDRLKGKLDAQSVNLSIVAGLSDVIVQDNRSLQDQIHHNVSRHLQNELIIGGVCQVPREGCKQVAINFFKTKLKIKFDNKDIWTAFCRSSTVTKVIDGQQVKCPPQLVVRVAPNLREKVMKNAKNLKGQFDPEDHFKYYVFLHSPEAFRATRAKHKNFIDQTNKANETSQ